MKSPINEYRITSDIFENDVQINFSFDPNKIINDRDKSLSFVYAAFSCTYMPAERSMS